MNSRWISASLALLLMAACGGSKSDGADSARSVARPESDSAARAAVRAARLARPPSGPPSIEGTITDVRIAGEQLTVVRVEENPDDSAGSAKASVTVSNTTRVLGGRGTGGVERLRDELRRGRRVRVWFLGPIRESYPVQARASALELL